MKGDGVRSSIFGSDGHPRGEDDGAPPSPTRNSRRRDREEEDQQAYRLRRKRRRAARSARRMVVLLVALVLVVGTGAVAVTVLWPLVTSLTASNDYVGSGSGVVSITVNDGDA